MISNERQYRITKARLEEFERGLIALEETPQQDKAWQAVQRDAISGQLEDLKRDVREYESLQTRGLGALEVLSFEDLPIALVQARIASGLTQRELADKLGLKEQQIQRYEATGYSSASLDRVREVIDALGLKLSKGVFLPSTRISFSQFLKRANQLGLSNEFLSRRILPTHFSTVNELEHRLSDSEKQTVALQAAARMERVFSVPTHLLFSDEQLHLPSILASARFKLPANADRQKVNAYAVYAHYLALLVLYCTRDLKVKPIPADPKEIYDAILSTYGDFTFKNCVRFVWSLGIPVLPLQDSGGFHGACWRVNGRNVIVLKQVAASSGRWIVDLFHETKHASQRQDDPNFAIVETFEEDRRDESDEESEATDFAVDVALANKADDMAHECVKKSQGKVQLLKSVVPSVAARHKVRTDVLANYVAHRLSEEQGQNWWGTAQNLQDLSVNPWMEARDVLIEHVGNCTSLNPMDWSLLNQALSERG
jgi:transcriptional regulator with XRE-family HTH domain